MDRSQPSAGAMPVALSERSESKGDGHVWSC